MSGPYGRQEVPDLRGADLTRYLALFETPSESTTGKGAGVKHTDTRMRIFALMLSQPDQEWTAIMLADALGTHHPVPIGTIRDTFYLLMHQREAEPVPFQRLLMVRLTPTGRRILSPAVARWQTSQQPNTDVTQ